MQKKKLLKLAKFLETKVKPRYFDMTVWCTDDTVSHTVCNTVACAGGWATACFPRSKLKLSHGGSLLYWGDDCDDGNCCFEGFEALQKMFGLSFNEAQHIFNFTCYPRSKWNDPKFVAKRIRSLVKNGLPNGVCQMVIVFK